MALASAYYELTLAAIRDLAGDRIVEEAVLEAFDNEPFEQVDCFADLAAIGALERRFGLQFSHWAAIPSCPVAAKRSGDHLSFVLFAILSFALFAILWANRAMSSLVRPLVVRSKLPSSTG